VSSIRVTHAEIIALFDPCDAWARSGGFLDQLMPSGKLCIDEDPTKNLSMISGLPYEGPWASSCLNQKELFSGLRFLLWEDTHLLSSFDFDQFSLCSINAQLMSNLGEEIKKLRKQARKCLV
jgi:hypothetical protein